MRILTFILLTIFTLPVTAKEPINDCETVRSEMQRLAEQLRSFENTKSFQYYGFAVGGPHNDWLRKAEDLRDRVGKETPMPISADGDILFPGKLIVWGRDRMRCATRRNCDRDYIRFMDEILKTSRCQN